MAALRERKKARQRAAILAAAVDLSESVGFQGLRVRDLIQALEISEATFFNYFPNKDRLLDAWLEGEFANVFARVAPDQRSLRSVLRECARTLQASACRPTGLPAAAWERGRVATAALAAVARCDLVPALAAGQARGDLRGDLPARELAEALVTAVATAVLAAHQAGPAPRSESAPDDASRGVRALDLVLDGARKRHERVRMGASGARPVPPPRA
jgi:AcrR family transcriptional regulator